MITVKSNISDVVAKLKSRAARAHVQGVLLRRCLAETGEETARREFSGAEYPGTNDTQVALEHKDGESVISATGTAVMFIEFGTGIRNAPYPGELPAGVGLHGTYGEGRGANEKGWIYKGEAGTGEVFEVMGRNGNVREGIWRTYGNPPACAMLNAANDMYQILPQTAKEVFGK